MKENITERAAVEWNESDAINLAQQGDAAAFECLYNAHCKHVYSLCLRMLRNIAEAEDLTQQVFLQLFRKIGTFRGDSSFSTWLHRISVNAVLMHLRRKRPAENQMDSLDDTGSGNADPRESGNNPLSMPTVIDRLNLKRAIRQLPAGYKRFFLLHDVMGYRHARDRGSPRMLDRLFKIAAAQGAQKPAPAAAGRGRRRKRFRDAPDRRTAQIQSAILPAISRETGSQLFQHWPNLHDSKLTTC